MLNRLLPGLGQLTTVLLAATLALLLAVSVLLHELGHCLAAARLGVPVLRVRPFLLGGVSELARRPSTPLPVLGADGRPAGVLHRDDVAGATLVPR